ncbi:MAG: YbhB/YbcL family Raf kinase inhibitor-like protein [Deltaproteobacteria bacterium]|nr:YbhB/YbcL family Raf kinase inhibitor-like protein [Deltaproteobacteria bacterium]
MAFTLSSTAFQQEQTIPKQFTCDGPDTSPELKWAGAPAAAKSFALIMDDPDAPPGTWVHWIIYDLPAKTASLPEGVAKTAEGPNGSKQGLVWGVESFSRVGYYGPCPPPGKPHRYYFKLYALDAPLNLPAKATKPQVEAKMKGHILGQAALMGTYGR